MWAILIMINRQNQRKISTTKRGKFPLRKERIEEFINQTADSESQLILLNAFFLD